MSGIVLNRHGRQLAGPALNSLILQLSAALLRWLKFKMLTLRKFLPEMVYLTRVEHFNAAHKLFNPAWSVAGK